MEEAFVPCPQEDRPSVLFCFDPDVQRAEEADGGSESVHAWHQRGAQIDLNTGGQLQI